jgi:hypothetical protein
MLHVGRPPPVVRLLLWLCVDRVVIVVYLLLICRIAFADLIYGRLRSSEACRMTAYVCGQNVVRPLFFFSFHF